MRANVYVRQWKTTKGERRYFLVVRQLGKKDQTISLGQVSRKVAEQRKRDVLLEIMNETFGYVSEVRISFRDFCPLFIEKFAVGNRSPTTVDRYQEMLKKAKQAFGDLMLDQVTQYKIESFLSAWPVSGRTRNIMLSLLRLVFQKAVDWRYLARSPAHGIKRFPERCQGSRALTVAELKRVLAVAKPWERTVIMIMVYAGLRPGEVSQLKFEHIDWENQRIRILASKTWKKRSIPLFPDLEATLRQLLDWRPNPSYGSAEHVPAYLPRTERQRIYVLCHDDGSACASFTKSLMGAFKRAGVTGVTPHGLRKTCCSLLARQGVHPKVAQEIMGHSDISLTMSVYTEVGWDQLDEAIHALPSLQELKAHQSSEMMPTKFVE